MCFSATFGGVHTLSSLSSQGRTELFNHYLSKVKADTVDVSAESLAKKTVGFLGAQIANMVNQAAIKAARENSCE